jgi:hypothetical protein
MADGRSLSSQHMHTDTHTDTHMHADIDMHAYRRMPLRRTPTPRRTHCVHSLFIKPSIGLLTADVCGRAGQEVCGGGAQGAARGCVQGRGRQDQGGLGEARRQDQRRVENGEGHGAGPSEARRGRDDLYGRRKRIYTGTHASDCAVLDGDAWMCVLAKAFLITSAFHRGAPVVSVSVVGRPVFALPVLSAGTRRARPGLEEHGQPSSVRTQCQS